MDLAVRHPDINFIANDLHRIDAQDFDHYLRRIEVRYRPKNLTFATGMHAAEAVSKEAPNSLDHVYAHFLLKNMPRAEREELYTELQRAMRPRAQLKIVENKHYEKPRLRELAAHGFGVTSRPATTKEAMKLGTESAEAQAKQWAYIKATENKKLIMDKLFTPWWERVRKKLAENGETPETIELIHKEAEHNFLSHDPPFVVITATKARERKTQ
ncbi:MAG: hypothetical protein HY544_02695 [Candidatus Diapherotrites archaeon]|uniref:Uncharacterized protein n=1 Tax=Candidatus Iainarchaeum sp. TaxID=3101447 RepID=A0A8T3YL21_9ARCH|nr:hypothetical protein [Candidatus Diapherotrites archaeon]